MLDAVNALAKAVPWVSTARKVRLFTEKRMPRLMEVAPVMLRDRTSTRKVSPAEAERTGSASCRFCPIAKAGPNSKYDKNNKNSPCKYLNIYFQSNVLTI
jgi:hypothetical protein